MASGRWAGSTRRVTLPHDWASRRARQLRNDLYRCQWGSLPEDGATPGSCNLKATDVDHAGSRDDHNNLRSLCGPHHQSRSSSQGGQAYAALAAKRYCVPESHPGLL